MVAATIERYPNSGLPENVEITSEKMAERRQHKDVDFRMTPKPRSGSRTSSHRRRLHW